MTKQRIVICIENKDYEASLELRKLYECLPDQDAAAHRQIRIIDESGDDYLYTESFFASVELPQETLQQVFHAV